MSLWQLFLRRQNGSKLRTNLSPMLFLSKGQLMHFVNQSINQFRKKKLVSWELINEKLPSQKDCKLHQENPQTLSLQASHFSGWHGGIVSMVYGRVYREWARGSMVIQLAEMWLQIFQVAYCAKCEQNLISPNMRKFSNDGTASVPSKLFNFPKSLHIYSLKVQ